MENKDIDFAAYTEYFGRLLSEAIKKNEELSFIINLLSHDGMTGDAATLQIIEFVPSVGELNIPILNENDSKNVFAISPFARNVINEFMTNGAEPKYNPQTHLREYMAEMSATVKLLTKSLNEAIRIVFMNRFAIIDGMSASTDEISPTVKHSLMVSALIRENGSVMLRRGAKFYNDMKMISGS